MVKKKVKVTRKKTPLEVLQEEFNRLAIRVKTLELHDVMPVPERIIKRRLQARDDTIYRAKEVFGLNYADSSDGLFPYGNQLGRRNLTPQDFGLSHWKHTREEGCRRKLLIDVRLSEYAHIIIHGFKYNPPKESSPAEISGFRMEPSGVRLPYSPLDFTNWYNELECRVHHLDVPPVISPRSMFNLEMFFTEPRDAFSFEFGIFGEVVAPVRYLLMDPAMLLIENPSCLMPTKPALPEKKPVEKVGERT
jgi:hypothetical protein